MITIAELIIRGKFNNIYSGLRRRFIYYFCRAYLRKQMLRRKGVCMAVGHCCKITMPRCKYLKGGKCAVYARQPLFCRIFPIDQKDQELSQVKGICGYRFE